MEKGWEAYSIKGYFIGGSTVYRLYVPMKKVQKAQEPTL